ncbi:equilibrative nucleoside transporter 3 [Labeo rohita]|uniref:Equilibrative nucleoside transporter 3 n=1 Tax=Labeo rohita TaxID=84645 RepID=A0A498N5Y6_LABRO|nr:equilibrative nucleoside transporter 3 [Labeo rohita]
MDGQQSLQASVNSSYIPTTMCDEEHSEGEAAGDDTSPLLSQKQPAGPLAARHCPEDSFNLVYIIFFLMGIGSLLPWNVFITAKQYWLYKLSNNSSPTGQEEPHNDLGDYFESYIAIASTIPSVLCLILNYLLVNRFSSQVRIMFSLLVILVVFVVTTVLVKVDMSGCRMQFFGGQAMGGTLSAFASIVDLAASSDVTNSALVYFITADIFTLVCIMMYLLLPRLPYSRYYMEVAGAPYSESNSYSDSSSVSVPPLKPILKKTWVLGSCVFYVFFISIMIFPAVSSGIQSMSKDSGNPWATTYFVPLTSFLLYNVADFCGRQVTAWLQVPGPTSCVLPVLVISRTALVPLFIFCNYQPRYHLHNVFFAHDLFPVVFVCLLGISNGYLGTLPMIYGPKVVPRELAEPAGVVMSFFLTLGLAVGSALSVVLVHSI